MSKEFEEIVLKKLEALDSKVENRLGKLETEVLDTKQGLKSLTVKVDERFSKVENGLGKLETEVLDTKQGLKSLTVKADERFSEVENGLGKLETEVLDTKQGLKSLTVKADERFSKVENRLGKLEMDVKDVGEVVNYLNQNFTKFDYEINKKIDTLFDAYTTNKEKNSLQDKDIVSLNAKVFNHDLRISNLEDKVLAI